MKTIKRTKNGVNFIWNEKKHGPFTIKALRWEFDWNKMEYKYWIKNKLYSTSSIKFDRWGLQALHGKNYTFDIDTSCQLAQIYCEHKRGI